MDCYNLAPEIPREPETAAMATFRWQVGESVLLFPADLDRLIRLLALEHRVIGPQVADGAVVLRDIESADQLPTGWLDFQDGGVYRLHRDAAAGPFDHVVGPHSLKNFLFPARESVAGYTRDSGQWRPQPAPPTPRPLAVIGVRGCDLAALAIQDRVFLGSDSGGSGHVDPAYQARRKGLFLVAVNCRRAAATCFCHSTASGPAACSVSGGRSADLVLTDLGPGPGGTAESGAVGCDVSCHPGGERRFACRIESDSGATVIGRLAAQSPLSELSLDDGAVAVRVPLELEQRMTDRPSHPAAGPRGRSLDTENIRDLLFSNLDHPRWDEVATRCLSCTNCTLVCPTCFCASVTEVADLSGDNVTRERQWASCFTLDHARMHGQSVRHTTASRYRQWLTHKLGSWIDQFGTSGCTGCGRCITWCPVGIDLTEEVAAIRKAPLP